MQEFAYMHNSWACKPGSRSAQVGNAKVRDMNVRLVEKFGIGMFFFALLAVCAPGLAQDGDPKLIADRFKLYFTDDVVYKCVANYPEAAPALSVSFERMKERNAAYVSAGDWADIRRLNEKAAIEQAERDGYINEIINERTCALVLDQLSAGGDLDGHISSNLPRL